MTTPAETLNEPFRVVDGKGGWLEVRRVTFISGGLPVISTGGQGYAVDPLEIPEITAKLYEAAGTVPPVMLGRPETGASGTDTAIGHVYSFLSAKGSLVGIGGEPKGFMEPHEARQAAAVLVAYADLAEPAPDPAEVEELAREIHASGPYAGMALNPSGDGRDAARTALLWMRKREAAS